MDNIGLNPKKMMKNITKNLMKVFKKIFSPKNMMKVLGRIALPALIISTLWVGISSGFEKWKETGSIWEAYKEAVGSIIEFITLGLIDKETVKNLYQGAADFLMPVIKPIQEFFGKFSDWVGDKFSAVLKLFGIDIKPKEAPKETPQKEQVVTPDILKGKEPVKEKDAQQKAADLLSKPVTLPAEAPPPKPEVQPVAPTPAILTKPAPAAAPAPTVATKPAKISAKVPAPMTAPMPKPSGPSAQAPAAPSSLSSVVSISSGVDMSINNEFEKRLTAMAAAFKEKTGKKLIVTSGFRSNEKQKDLYDKWIAGGKINPKAVAQPSPPLGEGRGSRHSFGTAIDIAAGGPGRAPPDRDLNILAGPRNASTGWLEKFGLIRPVSGEDWHIQPSGTSPSPDNPDNPGAPIAVPDKSGKAIDVASGETEQVSPAKPVTGSQIASASNSVAVGQRQQQKPTTPIIINKPTTNNTNVNTTQLASAPKDKTTGSNMVLARAA